MRMNANPCAFRVRTTTLFGLFLVIAARCAEPNKLENPPVSEQPDMGAQAGGQGTVTGVGGTGGAQSDSSGMAESGGTGTLPTDSGSGAIGTEASATATDSPPLIDADPVRADASATTCQTGFKACGTACIAQDACCQESGPCKAENGNPCVKGSDCRSGECSDGVCCDRACGGTCQTCAKAGRKGICSAILGEADPPACGSPDSVCLGEMACGAIDQRQLQETSTVQVLNYNFAQTITVGRSGKLMGIRLSLNCEGGSTLLVEVQELAGSTPGGRTLASPSLKSQDVVYAMGENFGRGLVLLNPPIPLNAGAQVAMVLSTSGGSCWPRHSRNNDSYDRGVLFSRLSGQSWGPMNGDLIFETIMLP
jgi:hypothetical protein